MSPFCSTRSGSAPSCSPPRTTLTMRYSGLALRKLGDASCRPGRDSPAGRRAGRTGRKPVRPPPSRSLTPNSSSYLLRRRPGVDAPPARQVFADQDDADRAPDIGDAVGQRDHRRWHPRAVMPAGSLTTPEVTACSAEPIAADMVCEPASMPPAAPGGRSRQLGAEHDERQPEHARHQRQDGELEAVALQAVDEGRSDAQADAVHEQVVEQALGEIVQLQLHAIDRCRRPRAPRRR